MTQVMHALQGALYWIVYYITQGQRHDQVCVDADLYAFRTGAQDPDPLGHACIR